MEYSASDLVDYQTYIKTLEKENQILKRKLKRSRETLILLEETNEKKESLLRKVIQELQQSQQSLEERKQIIDHLKRTQAQLVQTEKMSSLGQLVAGIAHEINNPVNFIHGNLKYIDGCFKDLLKIIKNCQNTCPHMSRETQALAEEIDLAFIIEDLPKVIASMTVGSIRISEIVRSLRNFSRLDESEFKQVEIHEGIDNTLLILSHRLKEKNHPSIQIIKKYGNIPEINCCPGQLNQVFMNLLMNAIDACEESYQQFQQRRDYTILVQTELLDRDRVRITIQDNGTGIPESVIPKLFDPFYTTKPIGKGTGLGLAISYQIITEKHNGTLQCHSVVSEGTTFTIDIPVLPKVRVASSQRSIFAR
jgi:two-component system NtrC family sensor kinase